MRIWQYTSLDPEGVGGVERHIESVSRELEALGHELYVGQVPPGPWLDSMSEPLILHSHGDTWPRIPIALKARWREQVLWIPVCHGTTVGRVLACREYFSLSGWKGALRDFLPVKFADAAVAVSEAALREARKYFLMTLPAKVISNGVDPTVFKPLPKITRRPRLAFIGRGGDRVKNTETLLKACASIASDHAEFELWAAPGLGDDGFLRNLGPLKSPELYGALSQCRALVLVSFYEGDPIVVREAMAMGLPVIVSDIPQIRATLEGYPGTRFVDPHNEFSLRQAILEVLFGQKPLKPTPFIRSWAQVATEFDAFYKTVLKRQ